MGNHNRGSIDDWDQLHASYESQLAKRDRQLQKLLTGVRSASLRAAFDPHGWFVYFLWGDDERPLYIGRSSNVLARLGAHLSHPEKRPAVRGVSMRRCDTEQVMIDLEEALIRRYRPPWNTLGIAA